jgi:hypothetical protein
LEKRFPAEPPRNDSPQIQALKQRAIEVRAIAFEGLKELDRLEAELKELRKGGEVK